MVSGFIGCQGSPNGAETDRKMPAENKTFDCSDNKQESLSIACFVSHVFSQIGSVWFRSQMGFRKIFRKLLLFDFCTTTIFS